MINHEASFNKFRLGNIELKRLLPQDYATHHYVAGSLGYSPGTIFGNSGCHQCIVQSLLGVPQFSRYDAAECGSGWHVAQL